VNYVYIISLSALLQKVTHLQNGTTFLLNSAKKSNNDCGRKKLLVRTAYTAVNDAKRFVSTRSAFSVAGEH